MPTGRDQARLPDEHEFRSHDDSTILKAKGIDDLATQLRVRYPDETHERFLRSERDHEAEQRKAEAMEGLIELLAQAAYQDAMRKTAGQAGD